MTTQDVYISGIPANGSLQTTGCIEDLTLINLDATDLKNVTYTVKCNGRFFIEESLDLYPGIMVKIILKDLLRYLFDFIAPDLCGPSLQLSSNFKEIDIAFKIGEEQTACYFWLVNNRIENIDPDPFHDCNFMTLQPRSKAVGWHDTEVLSYCSFKGAQELCCRAANGVQFETVTFAVTRPGLVNAIIKFEKLVRLFTISNITEFYFYLSGYDDPDRFGQKYVISDPGLRNTSVFYFENTAGGFDCMRAYGVISDKNKITTQVSQRDKKTVVYNITATETIKVNSGYLASLEQRRFLRDFFLSRHKYILEDGELIEIIVSEANANGDWLEAANFTFEYSKAFVRPEKSPRHTSFMLPVSEGAKFRLSSDFVEFNTEGINATLYFQLGSHAYSFPSIQNYEVVISDRIRSIAGDIVVDKFTDRIVLNSGAILTGVTAFGIVSVRDKLSGEEAAAVIEINY